ncbi:hypothetical protein AN958_07406 [Leucoagaricus sp. SymC.cos]|nr:hypothetical protein AN958_07406 [Leucoagaricus sp. SymC.cos]
MLFPSATPTRMREHDGYTPSSGLGSEIPWRLLRNLVVLSGLGHRRRHRFRQLNLQHRRLSSPIGLSSTPPTSNLPLSSPPMSTSVPPVAAPLSTSVLRSISVMTLDDQTFATIVQMTTVVQPPLNTAAAATTGD